MHLKAYVIDGEAVRTGSANFSTTGENAQDNDRVVIRDAVALAKFEAHFESMWNAAQPRIEFAPGDQSAGAEVGVHPIIPSELCSEAPPTGGEKCWYGCDFSPTELPAAPSGVQSARRRPSGKPRSEIRSRPLTRSTN